MKLVWSGRSLVDLEELAERAPAQASRVYDAVHWLARQRFPDWAAWCRSRAPVLASATAGDLLPG